MDMGRYLMNCTICGKSHSKEEPLTVAHDNEFLCPGCLKELDTYSKHTGKSGRVVSVDDASRSPISGYSGMIKVGNVELPIQKWEMK
jgi:transposase-like protein